MSETALEHLEHAAHHGVAPGGKRAAVIIAALAAGLAVCETAAKDAQTQFLSNHISASNTWAQYQAKSIRRTILLQAADAADNMMAFREAYPNSAEQSDSNGEQARRLNERNRIAGIRADADRMRSEPGKDGMEQLSEAAHRLEHVRDHEDHRHHGLEIGSGGLQLSIVLVSVSVVTGVGMLMAGGGILGLLSAAYGLAAGLSLF